MAARAKAVALAATLALLGAAACSGGSERPPTGSPPATASGSGRGSELSTVEPRLAEFYGQPVSWSGCGGGFQCARVRVPVDYAQPAAGSLRLALIRLAADGSKNERRGSLLVNPGGPGVSGIGYARAAAAVVSDTVRRHFDVVGFDPRGVGQSAPIRCLTDPQADRATAADGSPDDASEQAQLVRLARLLGRRCAARNPRLLAHVSTKDAARDLDVLRAVLGDARLNFLGKSYGTFLGATYAELFPARVGRVVLDGVVDPAADSATLQRAQAVGFERALASFVDDCLRRPGCPLTGDRAAALGQVSEVLAAADRAPLRGTRPVTQSLALLGIARAMYDPGLWAVLREALGRAREGDGSVLLLLADDYLDRDPRGHYTTNTNDAIYAINCLDRSETADPATLQSRASALARIAPRFGAYVAWGNLPCGLWPVPAQDRAAAVHAPGAAPILVVGTTRDPATPYAFARNLARELDSGRLLTFDGDGHTAYRQGSDCIDRAVDRYLVDGVLPPPGTRCG